MAVEVGVEALCLIDVGCAVVVEMRVHARCSHTDAHTLTHTHAHTHTHTRKVHKTSNTRASASAHTRTCVHACARGCSLTAHTKNMCIASARASASASGIAVIFSGDGCLMSGGNAVRRRQAGCVCVCMCVYMCAYVCVRVCVCLKFMWWLCM